MSRRWTLDLFAYPLGSGGRRVFLVLLVDDASGVVVGFGLCQRLSASRVLRVLHGALASHGAPSELYLDHGLHCTLGPGRGQRRLVAELTRHRIAPVLAPVTDAQRLGTCERVYGAVLRGCAALEAAQDLGAARRGLVAFLRAYNARRRSVVAPGSSERMTPTRAPSAPGIEQEADDE